MKIPSKRATTNKYMATEEKQKHHDNDIICQQQAMGSN